MRLLSLVLILAATACTDSYTVAEEPADSVRERLEQGETRLLVSRSDSAGAITASRRTRDGWSSGIADLHVESGELVMSADASSVTLERLGIALAPIEIPASLLGQAALLTNVRVEVAEPMRVTATWIGDDELHAEVRLDLALTWALTIDDTTVSLGAPDLPPVVVELVLTGNGAVVQGSIRIAALGELWSWADYLKLEDLMLILSARTPHDR